MRRSDLLSLTTIDRLTSDIILFGGKWSPKGPKYPYTGYLDPSGSLRAYYLGYWSPSGKLLPNSGGPNVGICTPLEAMYILHP